MSFSSEKTDNGKYTMENNENKNGFVIENKPNFSVSIKELTENEEFINDNRALLIALGKDYSNNLIYADLKELQHLLITGVSGYGKTNCLRSIIYSLMCKQNFSNPKLLLIDTKRIEFCDFESTPNLLIPIITEPGKACGALGWAVSEALKRLQIFSDAGVHDFEGYNKLAQKQDDIEPMPSIVIIIDDFYQVYSNAPTETEDSIVRLLQYGRICSIHLIIASMQADRKFLPAKIKSLIPSKISFALRSSAESKYIFERSCAERLTAVGDMIYLPLGTSVLKQVKCCYTDDEDVAELINNINEQSGFEVNDNTDSEILKNTPRYYNSDADFTDSLFEKAVETVLEYQRASTSFLERKLGVGFARASKLMDLLEERGIIGPQEGTKPREIKITLEQWNRIKASDYNSSTIEETRETAENDICVEKITPQGVSTFIFSPNDLKKVEFSEAKLFKLGRLKIWFNSEIQFKTKPANSDDVITDSANFVDIPFIKSDSDKYYSIFKQLKDITDKKWFEKYL